MSIESDRSDENPPEIEIEIEPASGPDAPSPSEESSATPPGIGDLPDDLPPVPDDDLGDLPPVPDDDLADLPPIDDDDELPPIGVGTDTSDDGLPPVDDGPEPLPPVVKVGELVLASVSDSSRELKISAKTKVGRNLCKQLSDEYKNMDVAQMEVEKTDSGWQVKPNPSATNETLLNSKAITTPQDLKEGDILSVGREAKGVSKMEMRVSFP